MSRIEQPVLEYYPLLSLLHPNVIEEIVFAKSRMSTNHYCRSCGSVLIKEIALRNLSFCINVFIEENAFAKSRTEEQALEYDP